MKRIIALSLVLVFSSSPVKAEDAPPALLEAIARQESGKTEGKRDAAQWERDARKAFLEEKNSPTPTVLPSVAVALDQLLNALIGGWADETFSARCWRRRGHRVWGTLHLIVDTALFFDRNHCEESYKSEVLRLQCPPALRPPEG